MIFPRWRIEAFKRWFAPEVELPPAPPEPTHRTCRFEIDGNLVYGSDIHTFNYNNGRLKLNGIDVTDILNETGYLDADEFMGAIDRLGGSF